MHVTRTRDMLVLVILEKRIGRRRVARVRREGVCGNGSVGMCALAEARSALPVLQYCTVRCARLGRGRGRWDPRARRKVGALVQSEEAVRRKVRGLDAAVGGTVL